MGHRITWGSNPRCDLPFNSSVLDVTSDTKTGWVGPMTLAQLVEFCWRVKKIRISGTINVDWSYVDDTPPPPDETVSGSDSFSLDTTLIRRAWIGAPPTAHFEADEIDVFRHNLALDGYSQWADNPSFATDLFIHEPPVLRDDSGGYWLKPFFRISAPDSGSFPAPEAWIAHGHDPEFPSDAYSSYDYQLVPATLSLGGSSIDFPLLWSVYYGPSPATVAITSATATIEVTEWFPYKTTAGSPAWDTATGDAINGGPGA